MSNPYRRLPAISELLQAPEIVQLAKNFPHDFIADVLRSEIEHLRQSISKNTIQESEISTQGILERSIPRIVQAVHPRIRTVINATGIVLHTNLGRSPMHETAARAAYDAARSYVNLELDLATGERSSRQNPIRAGICRLTGAEAATAVNNCAAATILALKVLAADKEVIVSRGQLIEIGGRFRIPEIMGVSGAVLREIGTTNITRPSDYETAIGPKTGAIMRIHASNYRIRGFTKSVSIEELVAIGRRFQIPVIDDVGSGAVDGLDDLGYRDEPTIAAGIRAGADLVLFSADKLLGGPQAGIIAGRRDHIQAIENNPLMRAFRLDKMALAALEATLQLHADRARAFQDLPTLRMLSLPIEVLRRRADEFAEQLRRIPGLKSVTIVEEETYIGGGSLPDVAIPSVVIAIAVNDCSEEEFASRMRRGQPAVVGRVKAQRFLIDLRTVFESQESDLFNAIQSAASGSH